MNSVEFKEIKDGEEFYTMTGSFVKVNEGCAKRTEYHWKRSEKIWRFSPISKVMTGTPR